MALVVTSRVRIEALLALMPSDIVGVKLWGNWSPKENPLDASVARPIEIEPTI